MSITLTAKFIKELKNPNRQRDIFVEIDLDVSTTIRWGMAKQFPDIRPMLKTISSFQNRLDVKKSLATKGNVNITVIKSDYLDNIIANNRMKNLRVRKYEGFIASDWDYTDYVKTFEGIIYDFETNDEVYTFKVRDIREQAQTVAPVAETDRTHFIDYSDTNPIDIMVDLINVQAGIAAADYDGTKFNSERDTWHNGWKYHRVITKSQKIEKYLEELQVETGGFIYHDGDKISFKSFAPITPGGTVRELTQGYNLLAASIGHDSGYEREFYNRVEVYYDYNESGNDRKEEDYESFVLFEDTDSQTNWGETRTKVIKCKWIRTYKHDQPTNITGVTIYHGSVGNGVGSGTLTFNFANTTLTWQANGDTVGETVNIDRSGKYQIRSNDENKSIRVVVDTSLLPGSNQSDSITFETLAGEIFAKAIGARFLNRYSDPAATINATIDLKDMDNGGIMYAPTDFLEITTDRVAIFGKTELTNEPCMLLSVRPNEQGQRISISAIQTRLTKRAAFIAPSGYPDYAGATEAQREYAFIGRSSDNKVYDGTGYVDGYYII